MGDEVKLSKLGGRVMGMRKAFEFVNGIVFLALLIGMIILKAPAYAIGFLWKAFVSGPFMAGQVESDRVNDWLSKKGGV